MKKLDIKELHEKMLREKEEIKNQIQELMEHELLDDDGYPTEECLTIIEKWHWTDSKGWFALIKSIWYLSSWGWNELDEVDDLFKEKKVHRYYISTAGWSGNEAVIRAMEKNFLWHLTWVESRRGGHYVFEDRDTEDDNVQ